jgi:hypothetical protein
MDVVLVIVVDVILFELMRGMILVFPDSEMVYSVADSPGFVELGLGDV